MSKRKEKKEVSVGDPESLIKGTYKIVPIEEVKPNTFNYNRQSSFIYDKMLTSLKEFGFVDPIDVRSGNEKGLFGYYEVIGGEHRLKAAAELGYTKVPVNDLGVIDDVVAKKLCIVLNETKGKADNDALASLIASLDGEGVDLEVLPFDEDEISAFIEASSTDFDNIVNGMDDSVPETGETKKKVKDESIMAVMGLLDLSPKKEKFLATQFKQCQNVMRLQNNPIRCLEKMMEMVIEG